MLRRSAALLCCAALFACARPAQEAVKAMTATDSKPKSEYSVLILNGTLIDGSGGTRRRADIAIRGDQIVGVGDFHGHTADRIIDASGLIVSPGFIDLLGQSQRSVLIDPKLEGKIRQGVTTEVTGEGHSPGPLSDAMAEQQTKEDPEVPVTWRSLGDFMRVVEKRGSALNFAFYIGASNPRSMVIGEVNRDPTPGELEKMKQIVDDAMHDGAVGITTSLIYVPAVFSKTPEIVALAKVAAKYGVGYWTHMRSESDQIDSALEEALRVGREANMPVNIFHLKVGGKQNWGKMKEIVARIDRERAAGRDVAANVYPYLATSTSLSSLLPGDALEGGYPKLVERLRTDRQSILSAIRSSPLLARVGGPHGVLVSRIPNPSYAHFGAKRLDDIAREMNTSPEEAVAHLLEVSPYSPSAIYFSLSEEDLETALLQPWVSLGSDSGAVVGDMVTQGAHPRAYGTFPRLLGHYVRDEHLLSLEEAVRRVTSLAAERVGFKDRGLIASGMKADLVVFDEKTIADTSTYEDPHHFAVGVRDVLVNGVPVLSANGMTGALPGRVLRGPGYRSH